MGHSFKHKYISSIILIFTMVLAVSGVALAADGWVNVGAHGFSAGDAEYVSLALDGSTPYVAYRDAGSSYKTTVMRFNGTSWVPVGSPGFSEGSASYITLAMDGGTPYVAYQDGGNGLRSTVMKYNGESWVNVGEAGFSGTQASYISLALDGSTPYVAYQDYASSGKAKVERFDGEIWENVGLPGFSPSTVNDISIALDGNIPYVAFKSIGNGSKAAVMRYNGDTWEAVGTIGFSAGIANSVSLALDGSTPYVAYRDGGNSNRATVMKYNGTSWVNVGAPGFSAGSASYTSLALDGSTPYVAYSDGGNSGRATVMKYDGTSWVPVDSSGFSEGFTNYTSLALDGSIPYVAFQDFSNLLRATVMTIGQIPTVTTSSPANGAEVESLTTIIVTFDRDMLHDGSEDAADNRTNYLLVEANGDGFQTTSCADGPAAGDREIGFFNPIYSNNSGAGPFRATITVDPLEAGEYQLLVCGSASIRDLSGNLINGGTDSVIQFTVLAADDPLVEPAALPQTGFAPERITRLPLQPDSMMYAQVGDVSLEIPSLGVDAPIVGVPVSQDGWDLTWLGDQAGWLNGTAFPSWAGNSAITAHVVDENGQPGLFSELGTLEWGDEVIVRAFGQEYVYSVRSIEKYVDPDDTSSVFQHEEYPWLTLITCKGYDEERDSYRWRMVVKAVQVSID